MEWQVFNLKRFVLLLYPQHAPVNMLGMLNILSMQCQRVTACHCRVSFVVCRFRAEILHSQAMEGLFSLPQMK